MRLGAADAAADAAGDTGLQQVAGGDVLAGHDGGGDRGRDALDAAADGALDDVAAEAGGAGRDEVEAAADEARDGARQGGAAGLAPVPAGAVALGHLQALDGDVDADLDQDLPEDGHDEAAEDHLDGDAGGGLRDRDARGGRAEGAEGGGDHGGDLDGQHDQRGDDRVLGVLHLERGVVTRRAQALAGLLQRVQERVVALDELVPVRLEGVRGLAFHPGQGLVGGGLRLGDDLADVHAARAPGVAEGAQFVLVALRPALADDDGEQPGDL
jgi:hypothetical protein